MRDLTPFFAWLLLLLPQVCWATNVPLRDGQVIVTESGGPISALMALIPNKFYPFSHSGIIAIEDGKPIVYEARGDYKMGNGTPAADWFQDKSGIRRITLKDYMKREGYAVVYDPPPGIDIGKAIGFARSRYKAGTPFDPYFDYRTSKRLYCAEFVDDALRSGGWKGPAPIPNQANPSLRVILRWWGIKAKRTWPVGLLVSGLSRAGELGDSQSRADAIVFNAFKKEIYRRFTANQKLGNIFKFDNSLEFRKPVARLLTRSQQVLESRQSSLTFPFANTAVRDLADRIFVPMN